MSSQDSKASAIQAKSFLDALNRRRSSRHSTDDNLDVPPISLCETIRGIDTSQSVDSYCGSGLSDSTQVESEMSSMCSTRSQNIELTVAARGAEISDMRQSRDTVAHIHSNAEQLTSVHVESMTEDPSFSTPSEFEFDDDARQFSTSFSIDYSETGVYEQGFLCNSSTDLQSDFDQQSFPCETAAILDADIIDISKATEHIDGVNVTDTKISYKRALESPCAYTTEQLYDPSFDKDDSLLDDGCHVEFCLDDDDQPMTVDEFKCSSYGQQLYQESASLRLAWDLMLDSDVKSTLVGPSSSCKQHLVQIASVVDPRNVALCNAEYSNLGISSSRMQPLNDRAAMRLTPTEVESAFMQLATVRLTKVLLSADIIDELTTNFAAVSRAIEELCCELSLSDDQVASEACQLTLLTDELVNLKDKQGHCKSDFYLWQADEFSDSKLREIQIEHLYNQILQTESLYEAALYDWRRLEEKLRLSEFAKKTLASSTAVDTIVRQLQVEDVSFWLNRFSDDVVNENVQSSKTCTDDELAEMCPLQLGRSTCNEEELATRDWVQTVRRRDVTKLHESNEYKPWNAARLPNLDRTAPKSVTSILKRRPKFRQQLEDSTYIGPIKSILKKDAQASLPVLDCAPVVTSIPTVNLQDLNGPPELRKIYPISRTDSVSSFQRSSSPSKQEIAEKADPNVGEHLRTMAYERLIRVSDRKPDLQRISSFQRLPQEIGDSMVAGDDCFSKLRNGDEFRTTSFGSVVSDTFDQSAHPMSFPARCVPISLKEEYIDRPVTKTEGPCDAATSADRFCDNSMAQAIRALQIPFEDLADALRIKETTHELEADYPECGKENRAFGDQCQISTFEARSTLTIQRESPFGFTQPVMDSTNTSLQSQLKRGLSSVRIGKSSAITTEFKSPASGSRKRSPVSSPFSHPISQLKSYEKDNKFWELGRNSSVRTTEGISSRWFRSVRGPRPVLAEQSLSGSLKLGKVTSWFKSLSARKNSRIPSKVNILQMSSVPSGLTQIQELFGSDAPYASIEGDESFNRRWYDKHKHTTASKQ